jgi:hypothetical protein
MIQVGRPYRSQAAGTVAHRGFHTETRFRYRLQLVSTSHACRAPQYCQQQYVQRPYIISYLYLNVALPRMDEYVPVYGPVWSLTSNATSCLTCGGRFGRHNCGVASVARRGNRSGDPNRPYIYCQSPYHHTLPAAPPERPAFSCRLQAAETTKRTARGAGATCRTPRPFLCFVSISGFRVAATWAPSRRARDAARRPLARKSPRAPFPFPFPARPVSNRTARTQIPVHACLSSAPSPRIIKRPFALRD